MSSAGVSERSVKNASLRGCGNNDKCGCKDCAHARGEHGVFCSEDCKSLTTKV